MKYALLIYADERSWEELGEREQAAAYREYGAISELPSVLHDHQLHPVAATTTVRVKNNRPVLDDGPLHDVSAPLGGYYLMEADDLQTALEVAARIPAARQGGAVEVRPVVER